MEAARIAVIGGGAWGTALAAHLCRSGHQVALWVFEQDLARSIRNRQLNPDFLPDVTLPSGIAASSDPVEVVAGASLVISAVPGAFCRHVYKSFAPLVSDSLPWVTATKGIEPGSDALPLDVLAEELGESRPTLVLSGPTFAREVALGLPAAVVVSGVEESICKRVQMALSSDRFRVYTNMDPTGVQVAGAMKNVVAIATGIVDGLGLGANCTAALITRGLAEISRLGRALGAREETFGGLAGLGDLVLTCTGSLSRNRSLGQWLGAGESLEAVLARSNSVAEGARTVRAAVELAARYEVDMPIAMEVFRILYEGADPSDSVQRLMVRPPRSEDLPVVP